MTDKGNATLTPIATVPKGSISRTFLNKGLVKTALKMLGRSFEDSLFLMSQTFHQNLKYNLNP